MLVHLAIAATLAAQHPPQLIPADSALRLMQRGGYTMIWRHAETDWSKQDTPGSPERAAQRNLTARGETDAKTIGMLFKHARIPVEEVRSSQMWRTRETAELAFGRVTVDTLLRTMDPSDAQKALIAAKPSAGTNRVLVTHHFVIERNVPGIRPGQVGEGEAVVVRPTADGVELVSVIYLADWERVSHGMIVANRPRMPGAPGSAPAATATVSHAPINVPTDARGLALMHKDEYVNVMPYLIAFNQGDAAMRTYFEQRAVPNPQRSIDQRLETYRQLKAEYGSLTPVAAELRDEGFAMAARIANGETIVLTFKVEPQPPYRLTSLSIARTQSQTP